MQDDLNFCFYIQQNQVYYGMAYMNISYLVIDQLLSVSMRVLSNCILVNGLSYYLHGFVRHLVP